MTRRSDRARAFILRYKGDVVRTARAGTAHRRGVLFEVITSTQPSRFDATQSSPCDVQGSPSQRHGNVHEDARLHQAGLLAADSLRARPGAGQPDYCTGYTG